MVEKIEDKTGKDGFSESSELFENIFKQATQEIKREKGKFISRMESKPKLKPEIKPKVEPKPKAPRKLELEPKEDGRSGLKPGRELQGQTRPEIQSRVLKPEQVPVHKPTAKTESAAGARTSATVVPVGPLVRSPVHPQKPKQGLSQNTPKPKPKKKKKQGSSILRILLLVVLAVVGIGGASLYLGIIDLGEDVGLPIPAKDKRPEVAPVPSPKARAAGKIDQAANSQGKVSEEPKATGEARTTSIPKPTEEPTASPPTLQGKEVPTGSSSPSVTSSAAPVGQSPQATPVAPSKATTETRTQAAQPEPKAVAVAQTPSGSGSGAAHPYSVYLGSFKGPEYLQKAMAIYQKQGLGPYWSRMDLGKKGIWHRVFAGYFKSPQEAEAFIRLKKIKDAEVKETKYSTLIETSASKQEGEQKILSLTKMGISAYGISTADGRVRVYSGAFAAKQDAEKNQADLNTRGIKSQIVER